MNCTAGEPVHSENANHPIEVKLLLKFYTDMYEIWFNTERTTEPNPDQDV